MILNITKYIIVIKNGFNVCNVVGCITESYQTTMQDKTNRKWIRAFGFQYGVSG